jgi:hypothetical protein
MNIETGEPLDALSLDTRKWAKSLGSHTRTLSEVLNTQDQIVSKIKIQDKYIKMFNV